MCWLRLGMGLMKTMVAMEIRNLRVPFFILLFKRLSTYRGAVDELVTRVTVKSLSD